MQLVGAPFGLAIASLLPCGIEARGGTGGVDDKLSGPSPAGAARVESDDDDHTANDASRNEELDSNLMKNDFLSGRNRGRAHPSIVCGNIKGWSDRFR